MQNDLEYLLHLLKEFKEGASIKEIQNRCSSSLSRRTLQRRLSILIDQGSVVALGSGRARKYLRTLKNSENLIFRDTLSSKIPLTLPSLEIKKLLNFPLSKRKKALYETDFLEKYVPNSTFYLPKEVRQKLHESGKIFDEVKPAGTYARQMFHRLLIDLAWNSSRLEGNTYSLLETEKLIYFNAEAEGKNVKETQMILNHKAAIEFLIESPEGHSLNSFTIKNIHALLSDNLLSNSAACGQLRKISVKISSTTYQPLSIPQVIEEFFTKVLKKASQIKDPFEQSFFLLVHIPYLQAFEDVNKRVSRLAANIPLIQKNLCPLSFVDVPQESYIDALIGIYEWNRIELLRDLFIWAYLRSCVLYSTTKRELGEPDPFRLHYRNLIRRAVETIVVRKMNKSMAIDWIKKESLDLQSQDQKKFIEVVEVELQSLHPGNIARYELSLQAYEQWQANWV